VKTDKLARKTDAASVSAWEKCARVMLSKATKLRVTLQAATHHITAGRARDAARPVSRMQQFLNAHGD
jgi:hypothetical protein